jgi:Peptide N-acetyl-beta-D-glucosaminyl asparaginase amidase A
MRFSSYLLLPAGLACTAFARLLPNTAQSVLAVQTLDVEQADIVPIVKPPTHSCKVNIVTHVVGTGSSQTYNHTYEPPKNCPGPWNKVVLTYTGASKGRVRQRALIK